MPNLTRLPRPVFESYEWQEEGACSGADAEQFFAPEGLSVSERAHREAGAKRLCARCPVTARCLEHALSVQELFGVWGGLSAIERRRLPQRNAS